MVKVENDKAILEVSPQGAEITSFKMKDTNIEYMWQGDAQYWAGRNPILFPMVSNTWNKIQTIGGKDYHMTNHGFARSASFVVDAVTDDTITLSLRHNADTLELYPFEFTLKVIYQLVESKVIIRYLIQNNSISVMPFSFGLHPAFNCPLVAGETFQDYTLEFSNKETLKGMFGPHQLNDEKSIPCDYELFKDNPTLCYEYPASSSVNLTNGFHGIRVDCVGYRWIAFWTKPNAPFMCIEPWHGHGDLEEIQLPFEKREGTIQLDPNHHYETAYAIEIY